MAKMSEEFGSTYLTTADVGPIGTELEVAVHDAVDEEVNGAEKTVVYLASNVKRLKPYIMNTVNGRILGAERDDTNDWPGWRLTLKIEETTTTTNPLLASGYIPHRMWQRGRTASIRTWMTRFPSGDLAAGSAVYERGWRRHRAPALSYASMAHVQLRHRHLGDPTALASGRARSRCVVGGDLLLGLQRSAGVPEDQKAVFLARR